MISVGILELKKENECTQFLETLSQSEIDKLQKIKNEERRKESVLARILLKKLYEDLFSKKCPDLSYTDDGKPYFSDDSAALSISHDGTFVAVAIDDERKNIGIDLQLVSSNERLKDRVEKRFLTGLVFRKEDEKGNDISFRFFDFEGEDGFVQENENTEWRIFNSLEKSEKDDFFVRWTSLEACLKLFGKGFREFYNVNYYLQKTSFFSRILRHGCRDVVLSIAVLK